MPVPCRRAGNRAVGRGVAERELLKERALMDKIRRNCHWVPAFVAAGLCLLLAACSTSHSRKKADKDVYRIIQEAEEEVFGQSRPFTIDTPYSERPAESIQPEEIILQRQGESRNTLTIENALELAIRNSRVYQSEKERLYLAALSLTGEQFAFRPQFLVRSTLTRGREADGGRFGRANSRLTVGQALASGADIGLTLANDLLRFYTGDARRSAVSTLSLNIAQPLLFGAGSDIAAEQLTQAERNVIYAVRSFSQFQKEFSVGIVSEFFALLQQRDIVRNRFADFQSRTNTTAWLQNRFDAGIETAIGVGQAQQAELAARNNYLNTIASYENRLDQFKIQLGIPLTHRLQLDDRELTDLTEAGLMETGLDPALAFRITVTNHLELLNDIDRFEDSQRQVMVVANRLKPRLDLLADASLSSERPTDYANFDFSKLRTGAGLEIDWPLHRLHERNQYRATLINFEAAIRTLSLNLDQKRNAIERGVRNLAQLRGNYRIQGLAVQLAEERVANADLNIQANRATVRDLVEAQDNLLAAKNSLSAALVDYLSARLFLLLDIGILNTGIERYWLKPEASTLPPAPASEPRPEAPDDGLVSPETLFQSEL